MNTYSLEAAAVACAKELKVDQKPKAKRIVLGADAHLRGCQVGHKVDHGVVGVVDSFRSEVALLLLAEKQRQRAEEVVWCTKPVPWVHTLSKAQGCRGALLRLFA